MLPQNCPYCGVSLLGEEIPLDKRHLYGGKTHYFRLIGIEVQGVYDGVLFYRCPDCKRAFHRWPEGHELRQKAEPFVFENRPLR